MRQRQRAWRHLEQGRGHRFYAIIQSEFIHRPSRRRNTPTRLEARCDQRPEKSPLALVLARWQTLSLLVANLECGRVTGAVYRRARIVERQTAHQKRNHGSIRLRPSLVPPRTDLDGAALQPSTDGTQRRAAGDCRAHRREWIDHPGDVLGLRNGNARVPIRPGFYRMGPRMVWQRWKAIGDGRASLSLHRTVTVA